MDAEHWKLLRHRNFRSLNPGADNLLQLPMPVVRYFVLQCDDAQAVVMGIPIKEVDVALSRSIGFLVVRHPTGSDEYYILLSHTDMEAVKARY